MVVPVVVHLYVAEEVAAAEVRPVPSASVVESFQSEDGTLALVAWRNRDRLRMLAVVLHRLVVSVSQMKTTAYL